MSGHGGLSIALKPGLGFNVHPGTQCSVGTSHGLAGNASVSHAQGRRRGAICSAACYHRNCCRLVSMSSRASTGMGWMLPHRALCIHLKGQHGGILAQAVRAAIGLHSAAQRSTAHSHEL